MSFRRIWSCLSLDHSGYALTATVAGGGGEGTTNIVADLLLQRFDKGTPTDLWSKSGVILIERTKSRTILREIELALTVLDGELKVWEAQTGGEGPLGEWVILGTVHDSVYSEGLIGLEGEGAGPLDLEVEQWWINPFYGAELLNVLRGVIKAGTPATGVVRPDDTLPAAR